MSGVTGNWSVGGNLTVHGSSSLDNGAITTNGFGVILASGFNTPAGNQLDNGAGVAVFGSISSDANQITTDGAGNMTVAGTMTTGALVATSVTSAGNWTLQTGSTLSVGGNVLIANSRIQNTSATLLASDLVVRHTTNTNITWTMVASANQGAVLVLMNEGTGVVTLGGTAAPAPTVIGPRSSVLLYSPAGGAGANWRSIGSYNAQFNNSITSGALSTTALSSGVAATINAQRNVDTFTPITYNPTAIATATCQIELSPDGVTFSTLATEVAPAIAALAGEVRMIRVPVPAGWRLRLTVSNATIGTTTYLPSP